MNEEKIENFWKWFFSNEHKIKECVDNESAPDREYIIESINNLILDIDMFTWEIGPGINKSLFFTISPNGDKELLKKSKDIIEMAPELDNWEFNYCHPPKDWDLNFSIYDDNVDIKEVDAMTWKYVVKPDLDNRFKILLEAKNIGNLDKETAHKAAEMVVTGELGEEIKITKISSIEIYEHIEYEPETNKSYITKLKNEII